MNNLDTSARINGNLIELHREVAEISLALGRTENRLQAIEDRMDDVKQDLERYRGFVGGIIWILGAAWAGLVAFKDMWR